MASLILVALLVLLAVGAIVIAVRSRSGQSPVRPFMRGYSSSARGGARRPLDQTSGPTRSTPAAEFTPPPSRSTRQGRRSDARSSHSRPTLDESRSDEERYEGRPTGSHRWDPYAPERSRSSRAKAARHHERDPVGPDYYRMLGVEQNATNRQIELAYRRIVVLKHPDRFFGDKARREKAETELKELNACMRILRDPVRRAQYDAIY